MVTVIPPKKEMQYCTNQTKGTDWEMTMNAARDILCALVSDNRRRQLLLNRSNIVGCPLYPFMFSSWNKSKKSKQLKNMFIWQQRSFLNKGILLIWDLVEWSAESRKDDCGFYIWGYLALTYASWTAGRRGRKTEPCAYCESECLKTSRSALTAWPLRCPTNCSM